MRQNAYKYFGSVDRRIRELWWTSFCSAEIKKTTGNSAHTILDDVVPSWLNHFWESGRIVVYSLDLAKNDWAKSFLLHSALSICWRRVAFNLQRSCPLIQTSYMRSLSYSRNGGIKLHISRVTFAHAWENERRDLHCCFCQRRCPLQSARK